MLGVLSDSDVYHGELHCVVHSSTCQVCDIPQSHSECHIPVDAYGAPGERHAGM